LVRGSPQIVCQRDFVLREHVAPAQAAIAGQESQKGAVGDVVIPIAVAAAPGKPMRSDRPQAVQDSTSKIFSAPESPWDIALGVLEIGLNLQLSPFGEVAVPAAEQIVSGDARIVAERLVERAPVGVALQREAVHSGPPSRCESRPAPCSSRRSPSRR